MATALDIVRDNPILTKHLRSKLRKARVITWSLVVVTLCLAICWGGYVNNGLTGTAPLTLVVVIQVITLVFAGAAEIGSSIGGARESGILDFHRVSPVPPLWLAVGFFLGAPILEYWLTALTLPFAVFLAVIGPAGLEGLLASEVPLLLAAWLIHAFTMLTTMVSKKPKAGGNRGVIGLIFVGLFLGQGLFFGVQSVLFDLSGEQVRIGFFGLKLPWMVLTAVYELVLLVILFIPSVRRMRSERAHLYTKPQAIAVLTTMTVLILGVAWNFQGMSYLVVSVLYILVVVATTLAVTITPDRDEYIKGLRRAIRLGQRRPSPWSDAGVNRIPLFVLGLIVLVGATVAWEAIEGRDNLDRGSYSLTIAIGVLTVAYVGLGLQAAQLFMRRHGQTLMSLFLFFAWFVPLLIGGGLGISGVDEEIATAAAAVSPLAGIAISAGEFPIETTTPARIAALAPALTFAFVFHFLFDLVQRRIDRSVLQTTGGRREPDPFDDLLGEPRPSGPDDRDKLIDDWRPAPTGDASAGPAGTR